MFFPGNRGILDLVVGSQEYCNIFLVSARAPGFPVGILPNVEMLKCDTCYLTQGECLNPTIAVGTAVAGDPPEDPYVRNYLIRLLP